MIEIIGMVFGFVAIMVSIPALVKMVRQRSNYNISISPYALNFALMVFYTEYGIQIIHPSLVTVCGLSSILNGLLVYLFIRYGLRT